MSKLTIRIIAGIVKAADAAGGICNLEMPCRKRRWRDCVGTQNTIGGDAYFWYNKRDTHSTGAVRIGVPLRYYRS